MRRPDPESLTEAVIMSLAGLNSSCTVVVTVQDENNNPPVFSQHEVRGHTLKRTRVHGRRDAPLMHRSAWLIINIISDCWAADFERALQVTDLIFLAGELDMPSNLRLIAMPTCHWRSFYLVLCTLSGQCFFSVQSDKAFF